MTSRFGQRATGVAAATAIILLIVLIVVLWTGVGQGIFHPGTPVKQNVGGDPRTTSAFTTDVTQPQEIRRPAPPAPSEVPLESREVVRPIKISPLGLHEDDLLYGSDQLQEGSPEPVQLRHHSGHFRHKAANIWDPHPVYEFTAFQRNFHLVLEHDSGFASPDLQVTHIWHNSSERGLPSIKANGCFYKGHVKGDATSSVAVSLCHGMTGHIRTSTGNYFIEPAEQSSDHAKPIEHFIYLTPAAGGDAKDFHHCGLVDDYVTSKVQRRHESEETNAKDESEMVFDYETDYTHVGHRKVEDDDQEDEEESTQKAFQHTRSKRSLSQEYFVEMLVVADSSMARYHGSGVENYILALMYIVSGIFKDASIGNPITIAVVKLQILYERNFVHQRYPPHNGVSAADMLREFCRYQALTNTNNDDSALHHDTALLLTRENICRNASAQKCETLGLAELGTMCDRRSSCSLVQDNGLSAAFTIAHELGHVLNMPHDDAEQKCQPHTTTDTISHVMSTSLKEGTDPWSWSECSRHFITEFLESRHSYCLKDTPMNDYITENVSPDILPGETIVGNRQCELLYGEGSSICSYMPVCSALWCSKVDSSGCQTLHMPWSDGTPCGHGEWCQKGLCVAKNRTALKKVDGDWGSWQGYGPCSRTCGGGVKESYRDCDNPRPQHGGRYCIGDRVRYKSCGTKDCPEGSKGFREAQCSAFDNNTRSIHGVPFNVRWVPKYGLINNDRCVLYCRVAHFQIYYPLKEKVIDGTPCAPESFDICVNGQCKPAGCDHNLHSGAQLDQCGKCNGNNDTCRLITGSYNFSAREAGYRHVVRIPAGSSNLDIRQHGINGARDDNYIVLRDGVTGGKLLNNDNLLTTFQKMILYEGVILEYSGCLKEVERINASRPLKKDLLVEVLSAGGLTVPGITYQYTVPKINDQKYMWRYMDEWDSCDQVCNGRRRRKMFCVRVDTNEVIKEGYCSASRKPSPMTEACNTDCILKWRITKKSECSSNCGPGTRTITKECVQEIIGHSMPYKIQNNACVHLPDTPPDVENCQGPCNSAYWKFGEWSSCSKTCGSGIQRREAYCVDDLERPMPENKCEAQERITEQSCQRESCPTWSTGEWSTCSVTCGVGIRTRGHWCQHDNQVIDMGYCDASSMPKAEEKCLMPACASWHTSDWEQCSATCGMGVKRRSVTCKGNDGKMLDPDRCRDLEKPVLLENCRQPVCPTGYYTEDNMIYKDYRRHTLRNSLVSVRWVTYEWQQCSVTCGLGTQSRQVLCQNLSGEETRGCEEFTKPATSQICEMPCYKWVESDWSACSQTCGVGFNQRQVLCQLQGSRSSYRPDVDCAHIGPKPPVTKDCTNQQSCNFRRRYKWKAENWSPCSKTCGMGERTRNVKCVIASQENNEIGRNNWHELQWVDDSNCEFQNRPRDRRKCTRKYCPNTWIEGEWSECSRKCGYGSQNRTVTCHRVNSYDWLDPIPVTSEGFCDMNERPLITRTCKMRDCDAVRYWNPEQWQPCTQLCGRKGIQRREYTCRDRNGRILRKKECKDLPKPLPRSRPCNRKLCGLTSCKDIQLQTNARSDGEYVMLVGGRNMSIYCRGMYTANPTEYLTLRHPDNNYSEFYDKRLRNPSTCPNNGSRTETCDCYTENDSKSGFTRFDKVRIKVETLEINTLDFTFSSQVRGRPIGLGEAGDCYSQLKCAQGSFRINLEGTFLQIPVTQNWVGKTQETWKHIKRESQQRVSGKCGGYCGSCGPSTPGKLKLHVLPP